MMVIGGDSNVTLVMNENLPKTWKKIFRVETEIWNLANGDNKKLIRPCQVAHTELELACT